MPSKSILVAQNPLILRCNRLMEAFAKSDDERDFYLDRQEGFILYVDLDKMEDELNLLYRELERHPERYIPIPKLTFYETKKIMEGFIHEKVYDIDTKEKLLDIIQSKEARENFLEFIYDHHAEWEKWQSYYQERSRIRIIEWLRTHNIHFVFEEDLEMPRLLLEKVKKELFQPRVSKDIQNTRKILFTKAKTYYSNEALNPRPKRGRPPKQVQKTEIEPQMSTDIYTTVPNGIRGFLFTPELSTASSATFSSRFGNEEDLFTSRRQTTAGTDLSIESINQKLAAIRSLSTKWREAEEAKKKLVSAAVSKEHLLHLNGDEGNEKRAKIMPMAPHPTAMTKLVNLKKQGAARPKASKKPKQKAKAIKAPSHAKKRSASKKKTAIKPKPVKRAKAPPKKKTRKK